MSVLPTALAERIRLAAHAAPELTDPEIDVLRGALDTASQ